MALRTCWGRVELKPGPGPSYGAPEAMFRQRGSGCCPTSAPHLFPYLSTPFPIPLNGQRYWLGRRGGGLLCGLRPRALSVPGNGHRGRTGRLGCGGDQVFLERTKLAACGWGAYTHG